MVECPLEGYDMSPFVTNNSKANSNSALPGSEITQPPTSQVETVTSNMWTNVLSSFSKKDNSKNSSNGSSSGNGNTSEPMDQQPPQNKETGSQEATNAAETGNQPANSAYDLYAVCNHHGDDLQGGHYTATCRNPTDGHWYSFDDMHTSKVDESDVVSADAYILFYQKQSLASNSSSTSSASSSSSSNQEHWVYRMPDFSYKNKTQLTKAQAQQPTSGTTTTATSGNAKTTGSGNANSPKKYATLPAAKSESSDISATNKEHLIKDTSETNGDDKDKVDQCAETKSLPESCEDMQDQQTSLDLNPRAESVTSNHNNHEDVSRPIDKNDVD